MGWREDRENFNQAKCAICDGTGIVSLQRIENGRKYVYGGYCCTCERGAKREHETLIGERLGNYVKWLNKGFQMICEKTSEKEVPF